MARHLPSRDECFDVRAVLGVTRPVPSVRVPSG
jgi:hypothetical protein